MRRTGLNTWTTPLAAEEWDVTEGDEWAQERVSEVFRTVVAEVKAETAKAQHLVRKARLG